MKKILLFAVLLFMAVPAMAASNVDITCTQTVVGDLNWVTVSYSASGDPCRVRAFGLDITLGAEDGNVKDVCALDPNYRIFPGQIVISTDGQVTNWGRPYDAADINDANIAVEMGSLYAATDPCKQTPPATSGTIFKFSYKPSSLCYTIDANVLRGGIVMEDPTVVPTTNLPVTTCGGPSKCFKAGDIDGCGREITQDMVDVWEGLGEPECWCYPCHCRGDVDGSGEIDTDDLLLEPPDGIGWAYGWSTEYGACADTSNDGVIDTDDLFGISDSDGWYNGWIDQCPE
jgi:hypothetical protein